MGFLAGWALQRVKVTIDHDLIDSALSDFPVLIRLSAAAGPGNVDLTGVFDALGAAKLKIAVTTSDGETECNVEVAYWDEVAELAELHVKVPSIAADADTDLYLYFDAAHADNTDKVGVVGSVPGQAVWDSNFLAVFHMGEDPSGGAGAVKDSTATFDGTPYGTMTSGDLVAGENGKAIDFDGGDDSIDLGTSTDLAPANISLETIVKRGVTGNRDDLVTRRHDDETSQVSWSITINAGNKVDFFFNNGDWSYLNTSTLEVAETSNFHYVAVTYNGTLTHYRVDGDSENITPTHAGDLSTYSGISINTRIARDWKETTLLQGVLDEVRISRVARSAAWIKATYATLMDLANSFDVEVLEVYNAPGPVGLAVALLTPTMTASQGANTVMASPIFSAKQPTAIFSTE